MIIYYYADRLHHEKTNQRKKQTNKNNEFTVYLFIPLAKKNVYSRTGFLQKQKYVQLFGVQYPLEVYYLRN